MLLSSLETRVLSLPSFPLLLRRRVKVAVESKGCYCVLVVLLCLFHPVGCNAHSFVAMENEFPNLIILHNKVAPRVV